MAPEIWSVKDRIFCHFGPIFALLPPKNLKNQTFENIKKTLRDTIILQMCTKNHDHMLHCSCDMAHDGCSFCFSFWAIFYTLPPNNPKNQN